MLSGFRLSSLAVSCLILANINIATPQEKSDQPSRKEAKSQVVNGAWISVSTHSKTKAGEPIRLQIELSNKGDGALQLVYDRYRPAKVDFDVTYAAGSAVPLTAFAKKHLHPIERIDKLRAIVGSATTVEILPGESYDLSIANVGLFFDVTLPGDYVINVKRGVTFKGPMPKTEWLKTQLSFTVVGP